MAKLERTYTIPLRREYLKAPRYQRAAKASRALRSFLVKHMKSDEIRIGKHLNEYIWMHGMRNPPHHVKVNTVRIDNGTVYAELFGKPLKVGNEEPKEDAKAAAPAKKAEPVKSEAPKAAPKKEASEKKPAKKEAPKPSTKE